VQVDRYKSFNANSRRSSKSSRDLDCSFFFACSFKWRSAFEQVFPSRVWSHTSLWGQGNSCISVSFEMMGIPGWNFKHFHRFKRWRRPVDVKLHTADKLQYHPEVIIDTFKQSKQQDDTINRLRMENPDLVPRTTQVRSIFDSHYTCEYSVMVRSMRSLLQLPYIGLYIGIPLWNHPLTSSEIFLIADRDWRKLSDKSLSSCKQTEVSMPLLD